MKAFIKAALFISTIAMIAFALNFIFGNEQTNTYVVSYLSKQTINGVTFYKYDVFNYLKNLEATFTDTPQLFLHLPEREWANIDTGILEEEFWQDLVNNLAFMLNVVITAINILLFPIRLVFYLVQTLLAIIGLPMVEGTYQNNPLKWLIDIVKTLTVLEIPYV